MKNTLYPFSKIRISGALILLAPFILISEASAYCSSKGHNVSYEWLERVELGTFSNASAANGGYADFSQQIIELAPGTVPISLEPGFRSSSYTEHWRVWIDFNQDDDFQVTELVYSASSTGSLSGSITIPNDVPDGETRMRVSMKYSGGAGACDTFTYGEVEDYTVRFDTVDTSSPTLVLTEPVDAAIDIAVTSDVSITLSEQIDPLSVSQSSMSVSSQGVAIEGIVSVNGAVVTFLPSEPLADATNYNVIVAGVTDLAGNPLISDASWSFTTIVADAVPPSISQTSPSNGSADIPVNFVTQVLFSEPMDPQSFNASTFTISDGVTNRAGSISIVGNLAQFYLDTPLDYSTAYTITIDASVTDLAGNALGQDLSFEFISRDFQPTYCSSFAQNYSAVWISSVNIQNFTSSSQGTPVAGYRDSTSTSFDVSRTFNPVTLTAAYANSAVPMAWRVFIDSNQDGVFGVDEAVFDGVGSGVISGSFSLPDTALAGHTRMRVSLKDGSLPEACGSFGFGQVVDYRVLVPELAADFTAPTVVSVTPEDNASDVSVGSTIEVQFSEKVNEGTLNSETVVLSSASGSIASNLDFDTASNVMVIAPNSPLEQGTAYNLEITNSVQDMAGNELQSAFLSNFVTADTPVGGVTVSGSVSAFGSQLQGVSINLVGDTSLNAISSNVGSFSFSDLPPGTYSISASEPGYVFTPASVTIDVADLDISSIEFVGEAITQPFVNGDFETGDFSGFTLYETDNGHTVTGVIVTTVTADGTPSFSAQIASGVQGSSSIGSQEGGGFYQAISLQGGDLIVDMDVAAVSSNGNGDGGMIEILFDGVSLASHSFGSLSANTKKYVTLSFNLPNVTEGTHELRIRSTRQYLATSVYHLIDNIVLGGTSTVD